MTVDEPRCYADYPHNPGQAGPKPERVPDPYYRSKVFIMLDDQPTIAELSGGWDTPPPVRQWHASDQGEFAVLAEFDGTHDEAIAWASARPNVAEIYLYSEETHDVAPLDRSAVPWGPTPEATETGTGTRRQRPDVRASGRPGVCAGSAGGG